MTAILLATLLPTASADHCAEVTGAIPYAACEAEHADELPGETVPVVLGVAWLVVGVALLPVGIAYGVATGGAEAACGEQLRGCSQIYNDLDLAP